tara:strand:+ start:55 stop:327 length:273 start_codon:yes stop_codon:yes gene_type:complete
MSWSIKKLKEARDRSNRTSSAFPDDTMAEHLKRLTRVKTAESLADIENSMSDRPIASKDGEPAKPLVREKLLPSGVNFIPAIVKKKKKKK